VEHEPDETLGSSIAKEKEEGSGGEEEGGGGCGEDERGKDVDSLCSHMCVARFCCARSRLSRTRSKQQAAAAAAAAGPSPYIREEAMQALSKKTESVHEQAGGVFSDGWKLELWRTTGMIEDT